MLNLMRPLVEAVFPLAISLVLAACVTPHLLSCKSGVLKVAESQWAYLAGSCCKFCRRASRVACFSAMIGKRFW